MTGQAMNGAGRTETALDRGEAVFEIFGSTRHQEGCPGIACRQRTPLALKGEIGVEDRLHALNSWLQIAAACRLMVACKRAEATGVPYDGGYQGPCQGGRPAGCAAAFPAGLPLLPTYRHGAGHILRQLLAVTQDDRSAVLPGLWNAICL